MATTISTTLFADNATTTNLRAWIQFIHDALVAAGWVQTADTGQITISTATSPGGSNVVTGYEVWKMADALQATAPVFMKIEYGSGSSTAAQPGIWITIGKGSNGTGTITSQLLTRDQSSAGGDSTNGLTSWSSGDTARILVALFVRSDGTANGGGKNLCFSVERSKDATGVDTNEGVIYETVPGTAIQGPTCKFLPFSGLVPASDTSLRALFPITITSSAIGADVYMYPIYTFNVIPKNPGLNFMMYMNTDFGQFVAATNVVVYGANHIFMPTGIGTNLTDPSNTAARLAIRYE